MSCYTLKINNSTSGFICGDLGEPCRECGAPADNLCDYPVGKDKTCDRALCEDCSREVAPDTHYCIAHHKEWNDFKNSGGVKKELSNVVPYKK